jgi:hypothetical protein
LNPVSGLELRDEYIEALERVWLSRWAKLASLIEEY